MCRSMYVLLSTGCQQVQRLTKRPKHPSVCGFKPIPALLSCTCVELVYLLYVSCCQSTHWLSSVTAVAIRTCDIQQVLYAASQGSLYHAAMVFETWCLLACLLAAYSLMLHSQPRIDSEVTKARQLAAACKHMSMCIAFGKCDELESVMRISAALAAVGLM